VEKLLRVKLRPARQRAANVPSVGCAANRPVDNVQTASAIGYSTTREPQNTHARWLTEPGNAVLAAGHLGGLAANAASVDDLFFRGLVGCSITRHLRFRR